jgi:hypothetical protein
MTLEDKFAGMAMNEPITVEIEGNELELDVRVEDIVPLMSMGTQEGGEQDIGEEDVQNMTDTFERILYRSYLPYYDDVRGQEPANLNDSQQEENEKAKEFINGLLVRKLPQLINKMVTELGWNQGVDVDNGDFPGNPQQ